MEQKVKRKQGREEFLLKKREIYYRKKLKENPDWKKRLTGQASKSRKRNAFRKRHLMKNYGITLEQFGDMIATQGGRCKICRRAFTKETGRPNVDHCHITKKVRGVLCIRCNSALGWLERYRGDIYGYLG